MARRAIATSVGTVRGLRRETATGALVEIEPADPVVNACLAVLAADLAAHPGVVVAFHSALLALAESLVDRVVIDHDAEFPADSMLP